ncbi:hypothetical protein Micbo1qcDRAFT_196391 [Microdochium bolleyi]|uniref:Subtilisin-like serine protease n=1 Tax=Microdochium bolleyi TaxID=196109 RepID=A0A136IZ50_9PEZI|nr:hypothetical protein Micbo1qcDRAFT_196391 [Microdochium bolleyi]
MAAPNKMTKAPLPFQVRVLGLPTEPLPLRSLLPASFRTRTDELVVPEPNFDFLEQELLVRKLNAVQDWLWACGRPMPPRPLHHQLVIRRDIVVTESPELHLLWGNGRLYLKPLPRWLLDPGFWADHLVSDESPRRRELAECARGFLFSYCALIAYETDFHVAQTNCLLPSTLTWEAWQDISSEIIRNHCFSAINPRYWYGELRLNRVNKIYRFRLGFLFRGYTRVAGHRVYGDLLRDNFAALATILGYVVIVLTSMQVGLGTEKLAGDETFQAVSWGFTIFSMVAPLVAVGAIFVFTLFWIMSNWLATTSYEGRRFREMGVRPFWRKQNRKPAMTADSKSAKPFIDDGDSEDGSGRIHEANTWSHMGLLETSGYLHGNITMVALATLFRCQTAQEACREIAFEAHRGDAVSSYSCCFTFKQEFSVGHQEPQDALKRGRYASAKIQRADEEAMMATATF